jgi:hypothetical protein
MADISGNSFARKSFFARHREVGVALMLWVASNAFVTAFTTLYKWEGGAAYRSAADLCRWDCAWYATVVESGYDTSPQRDNSEKGNWPFHPLFPLTAYPLHSWLKLSLPLSLVVAGKLALLAAIFGFLLLAGDDNQGTTDLVWTGSLVAFNPYLIYAHAGYAEPLYFALLCFAFYFAQRSRWIASGVMGGLGSATRFIAAVFAISYTVLWLKWRKARPLQSALTADAALGLLLCPLGLALYMLYLHHRTGDALSMLHIQIAWNRLAESPVTVLVTSFKIHHWPRLWGAMVLASFAASAYLFKLRKPDLGAFLAIATIIPLSSGFWSMARYIWWQPPFLLAICLALRNRPRLWPVYTAFASAMACFMIRAWFSGQNFVV